MRLDLNCGQFSLTLAEADHSLWVWAKAACTVEINCELFGFGSGGFHRQAEATDIMSDTSSVGRWIHFGINDPHSLVVLEKNRKIPDHLENQSFFNKALSAMITGFHGRLLFSIERYAPLTACTLWKDIKVAILLSQCSFSPCYYIDVDPATID